MSGRAKARNDIGDAIALIRTCLTGDAQAASHMLVGLDHSEAQSLALSTAFLTASLLNVLQETTKITGEDWLNWMIEGMDS